MSPLSLISTPLCHRVLIRTTVTHRTPTTVKAGFVSACLKAGYHVELAGGGHYNEKAVRAKVSEIQKLVGKPGVGVTLNALYINQRQFTFQLPLWQQMKKEGAAVEGMCVAAGIPSTEKAKEIIDGLHEAGIKHVAFKPGTCFMTLLDTLEGLYQYER